MLVLFGPELDGLFGKHGPDSEFYARPIYVFTIVGSLSWLILANFWLWKT